MQGDAGSGPRSGLGLPQAITMACRIFQIIILLTVFIWVTLSLGGLGLSPSVPDATTGANNTSKVFNWHPLFMTFAFVICMGEAVLAYRAPVANIPDRQGRKLWHVALHTTALASGTLGIVAAIKSHTLKLPTPIPNFYSPHSAMGILSCLLFLTQYGFGFSAYLWPRWHLNTRQALGPYHRYLGFTTFIVGVATMAVSSVSGAPWLVLNPLINPSASLFC